MTAPHSPLYRIGADENGLGARLGPLLVTATLARVDENGTRWLGRRLPKQLRQDLDDSKRLVSFGHHALGEAWARALLPRATSPQQLLAAISHESIEDLQSDCPQRAMRQCWPTLPETFIAGDDVVRRVTRHLATMKMRGVEVVAVRSNPLCVGRLNRLKESGHNRFAADLHAMERLVVALRAEVGQDVHAVCGKVGGIADYPKHFGPLSGRLHVVLEQSRPRSSYRFPGLGELHFLQDADASDPLVMLASLVGKYLRELLMARISRFYTSKIDELAAASGYHDPVTSRLVTLTASKRKKLGIPTRCFERHSDR